ncbi:MAG: RNA-guided endonuclease IscB [Candidatus Thorarchaeota archaeon]
MSVPVYVVNMRGHPLMPTTPRKARKLVKANKATVLRRLPFAIQLHYATGEAKQKIELGIDAGYSMIGFSATTAKQEVIAGEVELRQDVSHNLMQRKQYRRTRRNRLWYRPPRFNNRVATKKKGWFPPSLQHKLNSHKQLIAEIQKLLPITAIRVEIATFDAHKLKKPEISGVEYQQGALQGYEIREYLLEKWQRKCAYCGKTKIPLEVEHIIPKSRGGTNRVDNLTLSCRQCNLKKGDRTAVEFGFPKITKKAQQFLKATPFMNIVRTHLVEELSCEKTFGYITKHDRLKLGLEKSHVNDAFVIAGGTTQTRCKVLHVKQIRRNNRSIQTNRKGFQPSVRRQRYSLQPHDLIRYEGELYRVKGVFNYGKWVRMVQVATIGQPKPLNKAIKKVALVKYGKGFNFSYLNPEIARKSR